MSCFLVVTWLRANPDAPVAAKRKDKVSITRIDLWKAFPNAAQHFIANAGAQKVRQVVLRKRGADFLLSSATANRNSHSLIGGRFTDQPAYLWTLLPILR